MNERGAVFSNPGKCYRTSVSYHAGLRRYLLCQTGTDGPGAGWIRHLRCARALGPVDDRLQHRDMGRVAGRVVLHPDQVDGRRDEVHSPRIFRVTMHFRCGGRRFRVAGKEDDVAHSHAGVRSCTSCGTAMRASSGGYSGHYELVRAKLEGET